MFILFFNDVEFFFLAKLLHHTILAHSSMAKRIIIKYVLNTDGNDIK